MKAKRRRLTAATLSAFLSLAGVAQAQVPGTRNGRGAGGKNWHTRHHLSGKKGHKSHKRHSRRNGHTTPPPK
jgi:hypothetical protein